MATNEDLEDDEKLEGHRQRVLRGIGEARERVSWAHAFCARVRRRALVWLSCVQAAVFNEKSCGPECLAIVRRLALLLQELEATTDSLRLPNDSAVTLSEVRTITGLLAVSPGLASSHEMGPFLVRVYEAVEAVELVTLAVAAIGRHDYPEAERILKLISMNFLKGPHFPLKKEEVKA